MEENKQQPEDQGKEAKKVDIKYQNGIKTVTALMGTPDWAKTAKLGKVDLPDILKEIVEEKKEELIKKFKESYILLVEKKKKVDKTIVDKEREFQKIITEEKKAFNKEVDALRAMFSQLDEIEREYYETVNPEVAEGTDVSIEEPPNQ